MKLIAPDSKSGKRGRVEDTDSTSLATNEERHKCPRKIDHGRKVWVTPIVHHCERLMDIMVSHALYQW